MQIRDVMTWNVITVSSDTPIMEARKIMDAHKIRRLPVLDKGKLVGIVSKESVARTSPSPATSLSVWEINYLLAKMTVKQIMQKKVVTVTPDTTVEAAIALAQEKGIGSLPVMEDNHLVGIVTTNDLFYKILNPILGIGMPGTRLTVSKCVDAKCIQEVMECVGEHNIQITALHNVPALEGKEPELCIHLDTNDTGQIIADLNTKGYKTAIRER